MILFSLVSFQIWNKFEPGCSLKQYKMRKVSKIQIAVVIEPIWIEEKFIPKYTC